LVVAGQASTSRVAGKGGVSKKRKTRKGKMEQVKS